MVSPDSAAPQVFASQAQTPQDLVDALRHRITQLEGSRRPADELVSTGCAALDRLLPGGGLMRGTLVEWLAGSEGGAACSLAFQAAREACRDLGALVVADGRGEFYAPAAIGMGLEPERIVIVRPSNKADFIWAVDQALRCPAVPATVAWVDGLDGRTFRRFQLAAEQGVSLGLLVRPAEARHEPSWADVRWLVEPRPSAGVRGRRVRIHLLRCRGGVDGQSVEVVLDDETRGVHLAPRVAPPTRNRRAAGA